MLINIEKLRQIPSAMEITKFPASPLIKSAHDREVLVLNDGDNQYILGYVSFGDTTSSTLVYSQHFSGTYGINWNDMYNSITNLENLGETPTAKSRDVFRARSNYIGVVYNTDQSSKYTFNDTQFFVDVEYGETNQEAPLAPVGEYYYVGLDSGSKIMVTPSGSLMEGAGIRINVGTPDTHIHSFGNWDESLLTVETPDERLARVITEGTYASGSRVGFPALGTYHIYNFDENSSLFMGDGIIELDKSNDDNTSYAKMWLENGMAVIDVDSAGAIDFRVDNTSVLKVESGTVTVTVAEMQYNGNVTITGSLTVESITNLDDAVNVQTNKVQINAAGKLLTTGGSDLA